MSDQQLLPLRSYQREALDAVALAEAEGCKEQLVVLPTGCGKTVVFGHLIKNRLEDQGGQAMVLAHRDELLDQAEEKIKTVWPGAEVGVVKAGRNELSAPIILASIQTLAREARLHRFVEAVRPNLKLLVTDEAHHAAAASYQRTYAALGAGQDFLHVGFTATPQRADGRGLDGVFQRVVYHRSIDEMIDAGWLVPPRGWVVPAPVDLRRVRVRGGDFVESDLNDAVNQNEVNEAIARAWLERGEDRPTIAFAVSVDHAYALAGAINRLAGRKVAAAVDGDTSDEERDRAVEALRAGGLKILVNCQLFIEGFDAPNVACLLLARPTKSQALYVQMLGRGLRPAPWTWKEDCLVLDVVGVTEQHNLVSLPTIFGLPVRDLKGKTPREARGGGGGGQTVRVLTEGRARQVEIVTKPRRKFNWLQLEPIVFALSLPAHGRDTERWLFVREQGTVAGRPGAWVAEYLAFGLGPMGGNVLRERRELYRSRPGAPSGAAFAFGVAETFLVSDPAGKFVRQDASWRRRGEPATPKQLNALRAQGIQPPAGVTKAKASDLIAAAMAKRRMRTAARVMG